LIEALGFHGRGRSQPETDAVENHGDSGSERFERADLAAWCGEQIVGNNFQEVEAIEVFENAGGKVGAPPEADSVSKIVHVLAPAAAAATTASTTAAGGGAARRVAGTPTSRAWSARLSARAKRCHLGKEDGRDFRESVGRSQPNQVRARASGTKRRGALAKRAEERFHVLKKFFAADGAKRMARFKSDESGETRKNDEEKEVGTAAGKSDKNFHGCNAEENSDGNGNAAEARFSHFFVGQEAELLEIDEVIGTGGAASVESTGWEVLKASRMRFSMGRFAVSMAAGSVSSRRLSALPGKKTEAPELLRVNRPRSMSESAATRRASLSPPRKKATK
jgi:hypothetical protein